MKKIIASVLVALSLASSVVADSKVTSIGIAEDYGLGLSMQFMKTLDLSVGHAGAGVDFIFYRYNFMPKSKFFSKRPMNFYVAGGGGYVWQNFGGMSEGVIVRVPVGVNWEFHEKWVLHASTAPALNFQKNKNNELTSTVIGTIGVRYLF